MPYKKLLASIAVLALLTTLLAACSIHDTATNGPTVHMGSANFVQTTITISKGASITLVDDVAVQHIITNGTWTNSVAHSASESGAPAYNQTFNGNDSSTLGPFATTGSFHYYCTIHPNMNLLITVQ
jgi:plastocyanin